MIWIAILVALVALVGWVVLRSGDADFSPAGTTKPKRLIPTDLRQMVIEYISGDGEITEREIILTWIEDLGRGEYFLHAYCKLRKAERSFALSRIQSIAREGDGAYEKPREFFKEVLGGQIRDFAVKVDGSD